MKDNLQNKPWICFLYQKWLYRDIFFDIFKIHFAPENVLSRKRYLCRWRYKTLLCKFDKAIFVGPLYRTIDIFASILTREHY